MSDNNSNLVKYYVDRKTADIINKKIEKERMLEEEKNQEQVTDSNTKHY